MTDDPIDLDDRRSATGKRESAMRRRPANTPQSQNEGGRLDDAGLEAQMLSEPARSWIDVLEKCRFLLNLYASSPDAKDVRTQKLIERTLSDMARLSKREERDR